MSTPAVHLGAHSSGAVDSSEDFWDDLLAFIQAKRVIPVVGPELLNVRRHGATVSLYRCVAERLLERYRLDPDGVVLRKHHELNDAVSALVEAGKRVRDLYRPTHDALQEVLETEQVDRTPLDQLASIRDFDLFTTLTPDALLASAVDRARFSGQERTVQVPYAPSLPTDRRMDIPELRSSGYSAVFYIFGKTDVSPFYAIHDEDALEYAYTLQQVVPNGVPPVRMFAELRNRNLLLIGCNLADWLSRFFLRIANEKRLSSDERPKREFLVDQNIGENAGFTVFLERFSRDSRFLSMPASDFVAELHRRWTDRNPPSPPPPPLRLPSGPVASAFFISYAGEDIAAARQICADLQKIGSEVIWFDKDMLLPGDKWNEHIENAIRHCDLFLPLLSENTQQRDHGYFRKEWTRAAARSEEYARAFLVPLVIDPDFERAGERFDKVPPLFREVQYVHAPGGRMTDQLEAFIRSHLRERRRVRGG